MYILALDKAGELIWSHVYGDERKDVAHGAARMSDGSIIVVGESNSFKRAKNFYMIKLLKGKITVSLSFFGYTYTKYNV